MVVNALTELYVMFQSTCAHRNSGGRASVASTRGRRYSRKEAPTTLGFTGTIRRKERFRSYIKVPELAMFLREITDYRTAEMINLDVPEKNVRFLSAPTLRAGDDRAAHGFCA